MPGRTMVVRLAESLELSLRARNALLLAAGYAPVFPESRLDDDALRPVRDALDGILEGHMPYPAVVAGRAGALVAANAAADDVLAAGAAPELLRSPVNLLRLAVHPHGMGCRVENLPEWGRHIIENVRAQALRSPDPRLDELLGELDSHVPPIAPGRDHIGFAVPLRVTLAELHLEAFLPADSATARILQERGQLARRKPRGRPPPRACRQPARLTAVYRTARKTLSGWSPSTGIHSLTDTTDQVGRRWTRGRTQEPHRCRRSARKGIPVRDGVAPSRWPGRRRGQTVSAVVESAGVW